MTPPDHDHEYVPDPVGARLFAGSGEARALSRDFDWASTPLGPVGSRPQSLLRTAVDSVSARRSRASSGGAPTSSSSASTETPLPGPLITAIETTSTVKAERRLSDVSTARRLGLAGMREPAAILGGTLAVEPSPGAETTLYARLHALPNEP